MKLQDIQEATYHGDSKIVLWVKKRLEYDQIPDITEVEDAQSAIDNCTDAFGPPNNVFEETTTWLNLATTKFKDEAFGIDLTIWNDGVVEVY